MGWISVSIRDGTNTLIQELSEELGFSSKDECIRVMAKAVQARLSAQSGSLNGHESLEVDDLFAPMDEVDEFIGSDDSDRLIVIQDNEVQEIYMDLPLPMAESSHLSGALLTACCSEQVLSFECNNLIPQLSDGLFQSFSTQCPECGAQCTEVTLYVGKVHEEYDGDLLRDIFLYSYWPSMFTAEDLAFQEFKEQVEQCKTVCKRREWDWLPEPSIWIEAAGVSKQRYFVDFFASYIGYLCQQASLSVDPPIVHETACERDDCDLETNHLHLTFESGDLGWITEDLSTLSESWSDATLLIDSETNAVGISW